MTIKVNIKRLAIGARMPAKAHPDDTAIDELTELVGQFASEEWRVVPGFAGYEVSSMGRVRSSKRSTSPRMLKQKYLDGRARVTLCSDVQQGWLVHRLVMLCFRGPCPPGMVVCHNNGRPSDNRLENLRYDTQAGNQADREAHGTMLRGDRHPARSDSSYIQRGEQVHNARLTVEAVEDIRTSDLSRSELAAKYGVHPVRISKIRSGRAWAHVPLRAKPSKHAVKLTTESALEIRRLYEEGVSAPKIAASFGVASSTIYRAIHGNCWTGSDRRKKASA